MSGHRLSLIVGLFCFISTNAIGGELVIDYSKAPKRYLNQIQNVVAGFCFFDKPDYVCVGQDAPYVVIAKSIPDGSIRAAIDENCAGLDAAERNPIPVCRYGFRFVAIGFRRIISDYSVHDRLRRNAQIVEFRAERLEPQPMKP